MKIDINELIGFLGGVAISFSVSIEASSKVFIEGSSAAKITADQPWLLYTGWSMIILSTLLKTLHVDPMSYLRKQNDS